MTSRISYRTAALLRSIRGINTFSEVRTIHAGLRCYARDVDDDKASSTVKKVINKVFDSAKAASETIKDANQGLGHNYADSDDKMVPEESKKKGANLEDPDEVARLAMEAAKRSHPTTKVFKPEEDVPDREEAIIKEAIKEVENLGVPEDTKKEAAEKLKDVVEGAGTLK
ncbi:unnamed protein product [Cylicostephanus goldi]|uniref:Uncharacterized protein n=1 Tax=Cylicostephanus goldi TaxID=71465 RepID=A0A3P6QC20_CYLGO|nr:unnamed protein product [Cylicostephanus goldi]